MGHCRKLPILNKIPTFLGPEIRYYSSKGSDRLNFEKKNDKNLLFFDEKVEKLINEKSFYSLVKRANLNNELNWINSAKMLKLATLAVKYINLNSIIKHSLLLEFIGVKTIQLTDVTKSQLKCLKMFPLSFF